MKLSLKLLTLYIFISLFSACSLIEKFTQQKSHENQHVHQHNSNSNDIEENIVFKAENYRLARPVVWKQEHIKAKMQFNIDAQRLTSSVELTFTPNIKSKTLEFDAVGFKLVDNIKLLNNQDSSLMISAVEYVDSSIFKITFNKACTFSDTIKLGFSYQAHTPSLYKRRLIAKKDHQGLFYINPKGTSSKPTQIWSQGECQSNSAWIPCIDAPNQKTSQEIYLTVDTPYSALSNGRLVYMLLNNDGTRTYYWKQEAKHAPYLTMIALGKFAIIEDDGPNNLPLYYYVEPEFAKYAKMIFGKTPEIISFFEKTFGYDYPWDKYAQVCVRDFISGAMENTSATTITQSAQQDSLTHGDYNYENYIVHEIAHQWFGDLVTAESWANIGLNESFATYAEYLWIEHHYGDIKAFETLNNFRNSYFSEASLFVTPLVHYQYPAPDDMFNRHSYQKGALFVHALRKELGDTHFFEGLKHYLSKNAFKSADFDHLRHSFETVSGRDLKFFFHQFSEQASHPQITYNWVYNDSTKEITVAIRQNQSYAGYYTYNLHHTLNIGYNNKNESNYNIHITKSIDTFIIKSESKPEFIFPNIDQNPLIEWETEINNYQWPKLFESDKIEKHLIAAIEIESQWTFYNKEQKSNIVKANNKWGRKSTASDLLIIRCLTKDSVYYDITPLKTSAETYVLRKTIDYLGSHNQLNSKTLNELYPTNSYNVKHACLNQFSRIYNKQTETLLIKDFVSINNKTLEDKIIRVLITKGSADVNPVIQNYGRTSGENMFAYNFYAIEKGYDFFLNQISFYEETLAGSSLTKEDAKRVLSHLEIQVKTSFGAEEQILALKKIDNLKALL
ncbi:MAG: M1 family metallopeptidase [Bacteroidia bacterium]